MMALLFIMSVGIPQYRLIGVIMSFPSTSSKAENFDYEQQKGDPPESPYLLTTRMLRYRQLLAVEWTLSGARYDDDGVHHVEKDAILQTSP